MRQQYKSFEEVQEDLKILRLQKEIDKEKCILSYNHLKEDMDISPKRIVGNAVGTVVSNAAGSIAKKALFVKIVGKMFKM